MDYRYENEIDLIELFHHCLQKWRTILLAAIIGAALFGAYNGYKQAQPVTAPTAEENEAALNKLRKGLTDLEVSEVDTLAEMYDSYVKVYEEKELYGEKSIRLNMDPEHVHSGASTYIISDYYDNQGIYTVESQDAGNIVALYSELLTDDKTIDAIKEATGWDVDRQYVRELYGVSSTGVSLLRISTIAPSEDECRIIIKVLEERLEQVKPQVQANAKHEIAKVNDKYFEDYSSSITDAQKAQSDTLISLKNTMRNIPNNLTSDQKAYYQEIIKQNYPDEIKEKEFSVFSLIKFIIIGCVAGAFVVLFCIALVYALKQVLRTEDDMSSLFSTRVIGTVKACDASEKKKFLSGIDNWYEKKFDKKNGILPEAAAYDMIASEIAVGIEKGEIKKPFITSTSSDKAVADVVNRIAKGTSGLTKGASVVTDADALKTLSESDGVVIVEKIQDSRISNIGRELELCKKYGINVIGAVVVR